MSLKMLADTLKVIMDREKEVINNHPIKHGPTIGDMYEGLTRSLLEGLNLAVLGLKVVSGFMRTGDTFSGQLDCMVVVGDGEEFPYLPRHVYPAEQVLAVFEIKKKLYAGQFEEAYGQLADVYRISTLDLERQQAEGTLVFNASRPAMEMISVFKKEIPHFDEINTLPLHERAVYQMLVKEHVAPLRIAIGYYGFKRHSSMREVVGDFFIKGLDNSGVDGLQMPNLVVSENNSIFKTTGTPYFGDWDEEHGWLWLCSSSENPACLILEFLIDKIERSLGVSINRGEDLDVELYWPLVYTYPRKSADGQFGFYHTVVPADAFCADETRHQWAPYMLSLEEKELLELLGERIVLSVSSKVVNSFLLRHSLASIDSFVVGMVRAGVLLRSNDALTVRHDIVIVKVQGQLYCADNSGGRFANWVNLRSDVPFGQGVYIKVGRSF